jgi:predicted amidohydrolase YtcJ
MTHDTNERTRIFAARTILTMDPARPQATHVAVRGGTILAVGGEADMAAWPDAERIDRFRGKVLMPGLIEAHSHLMEGAMWEAVYLGYFDRRDPDGRLWPGLRTLDAVLDRLAEAERSLPDAQATLLAWGFDPILFGSSRLSVRELDHVSRTRPIAILHASVHLMNVNSTMLALAGIDEDTDIDGIHKDAEGRPTGELQEFAAMYPVQR